MNHAYCTRKIFEFLDASTSNNIFIESANDDVEIVQNWKEPQQIPELNVFIDHLKDDLNIN